MVGRQKGVHEAQVHSTCQVSKGVFPKKYQILLGFNGACKAATFPMQANNYQRGTKMAIMGLLDSKHPT